MKKNTVTQICTATDLIKGNYESSFNTSDMTSLGDFGLGTFNCLNGEMIILDGITYRANKVGHLESVANDQSPFLITTFFCPQQEIIKSSFTKEGLTSFLLSEINLINIYAIKVTGLFTQINLRSSAPVSKPFPNFKIVSESSNYYDLENTTGSLIGFYFPESFSAISTSGFHFHFIDTDNKIGGHVIDLKVENAKILLDKKTHFNLTLPII